MSPIEFHNSIPRPAIQVRPEPTRIGEDPTDGDQPTDGVTERTCP